MDLALDLVDVYSSINFVCAVGICVPVIEASLLLSPD